MPLKPFHNCFRATSKEKNPIFCPKMPQKCQFLAIISVFLVWVVTECPCCPISRALV